MTSSDSKMEAANKAAQSSSQALPAGDFAEELQIFWYTHRKWIILSCTAIFLGIICVGAFRVYREQRDAAIARAYAAAGNVEKQRQFAIENSAHPLAAVVWLKLADEAYTAGRYADAVGFYEKATDALKEDPLLGRSKLGLGMARILSGKAAEGEKVLKSLAEDTKTFKALRSEAAYHLLTGAIEIKQVDTAKKYAELLQQIDPSSLWAQRAVVLMAGLEETVPTVQLSPVK